jgi:hypothetical protein
MVMGTENIVEASMSSFFSDIVAATVVYFLESSTI